MATEDRPSTWFVYIQVVDDQALIESVLSQEFCPSVHAEHFATPHLARGFTVVP